jgi:hypothetical protein
MSGRIDYTWQDFINDASPEQWAEWEQEASELEVTVDYYIQEVYLYNQLYCAT